MRQLQMLLLKRAATLLVAVIAAGFLPLPPKAAAHEEGVLKLARRTVAVGDTIDIAGEKFGRNSRLVLVLVGVRGRVELAKVRADSAGAFSVRLAVPTRATAGAYRLVAVAADGDEVASVDVMLTPLATEAKQGMTALDEPADETHPPSAEPLQLARAHSGTVLGTAVGVIVLALVLGIGLLRRPSGAE